MWKESVNFYVFHNNLLPSFGAISKWSHPTTRRFRCDKSHLILIFLLHYCLINFDLRANFPYLQQWILSKWCLHHVCLNLIFLSTYYPLRSSQRKQRLSTWCGIPKIWPYHFIISTNGRRIFRSMSLGTNFSMIILPERVRR